MTTVDPIQHEQKRAEQFCVKWRAYDASISQAFRDLKSNKNFLDVTVVCKDYINLEAHKVVLGACSPFFRMVLSIRLLTSTRCST